MNGVGLVEQLTIVEADIGFVDHREIGRIIEAGVTGEEGGLTALIVGNIKSVAGPIVFAFDVNMIGREDFENVRTDVELILSGLTDQRADKEIILKQRVSVLNRVQAAFKRVVPQIDEDVDGADQFGFERLSGLGVLEDEGVGQRHLFEAADVVGVLVRDEDFANCGIVDCFPRRTEVFEAGFVFELIQCHGARDAEIDEQRVVGWLGGDIPLPGLFPEFEQAVRIEVAFGESGTDSEERNCQHGRASPRP